MWPFSKKKKQKVENQVKISEILGSLSEKFDKLEDQHKKLKGWTYRKAHAFAPDEDDEEEKPKKTSKFTYQGVEITGVPEETLQWIRDNDPV